VMGKVLCHFISLYAAGRSKVFVSAKNCYAYCIWAHLVEYVFNVMYADELIHV
jgi:hypothetical protein